MGDIFSQELLNGSLCFKSFLLISAPVAYAQHVSAGIKRDPVHLTRKQIQYQRQEKIVFVHFGVNIYSNQEWETGEESPLIFNPDEFDAGQ